MAEATIPYLNKFVIKPSNPTGDIEIRDFSSINGVPEYSRSSALEIAVTFVHNKNMLTHPILRRVTEVT